MMLSDETLARIARLLDAHDVEHGRLRDVSTPNCLNKHVSDGSKVFVKVEGPQAGVLDGEPVWARWAHASGLSPVRPLLDVPVGDGEITVLPFEHGVFCRAGSRLDQVNAMIGLLSRLRATPSPASAPITDPALYVSLVEGRIETLGSAVPSGLVEVLLSAAHRAATDFADAAQTALLQPSHGDAHLVNMVATLDGRHHLVDWPSFGLAPKEWDLGQLLRALALHSTDLAPDYRTSLLDRVITAESDVDLSILDATLRLRSASWATFRLIGGEDPGSPLLTHAAALAERGLDLLAAQGSHKAVRATSSARHYSPVQSAAA